MRIAVIWLATAAIAAAVFSRIVRRREWIVAGIVGINN